MIYFQLIGPGQCHREDCRARANYSIQITQAPKPYTQTFSRTKSSKANQEDDGDFKGDKDGKLMDQLMSDIENDNMTLDERLVDMGLDPKQYKRYGEEEQAQIHHADQSAVYGKANRSRIREWRSGSPRLARKRSRDGRRCKILPMI